MSTVAVRRRSSRNSAGRVGVVSMRVGGVSAVGAAIGRSGVPDIQRARMLGALVEAVREHGAARVTVAHIVARSGVSRRTFYEMFADRDACFLAALEAAIERGVGRVLPAFQQGAGDAGGGSARVGGGGVRTGRRGAHTGGGALRWHERVRTGLAALLEFLDEEPGLGGLCVVDALSAGPRAMERRAEVVRALVSAVDGGRREARAGLHPSRLTAEGVVGGVLSVLYARLAERDPEPMVRLLNPLMGMIVLPYLGPAAADRELARPAPRARRRTEHPPSNPLEGLGMRLTYRTVRVLGAIAARPGASNRQVADASGVLDQGQISKLLARLEHVGLVANGGLGPLRGEPNVWRLTERGREVEHAIRQQTTPTAA